MSGIILRIALVIILCIQATLWSQTRQAGLQASPISYPSSLWSRSVLDIDQIDLKRTCSPRSFPLDQQCAHVQKSCPPSETLLSISYVQKYFCSPSRLRTGYFLGLVVWLIFLFSTLGISASDFFCPNLATISEILGLDEDVAGVTFLALGNGSPDVFSTFSAMKANSGSLAIGELLGAASFIVSVVVGSMAIIKPFKVNKGPFLRDVGFFAIAIVLLLAVLIDGRVTAWEAGLLVLLYVIYVAVVVVQSWYERRKQRKRKREHLLRAQYDAEDTDDIVSTGTPYRDDPEAEEVTQDNASDETVSVSPTSPVPNGRVRAHSSASTSANSGRPNLALHMSHHSLSRNSSMMTRRMSHASHIQNLPSYSLLGALEFRTAVNNLRRQSSVVSLHHRFETSPITPYAGGHYPNPLLSTASKSADEDDEGTSGEANPWERTLEVPLDDRHRNHIRHSSDPHNYTSGLRGKSPTLSVTIPAEESLIIRSPGEPSPSPTSAIPAKSPAGVTRIKSITGRILHVLFPTLHNFGQKSAIAMVAALFAAPAVLALTLTLPVVVTPREGDDFLEKNEAVVEGAPTLGNLIDFEEEGIERPLVAAEEQVEEVLEEELHFNKWLMATQCIFGPLFCVAVLFGIADHFKMICALVAGTVTSILVIAFANKGNDPAARVARTTMGFFIAIVWIMAIADEVVQVLQTFGFIFGLSDAIIGLTIFAVGNSLADFVANITVAAFAPIMGFSACFGGPMLNILLGVGLSGTYVIRQTGADYELNFSTTLLVSSIGLLILLLATILFVPWNGYMLSRSWGFFLIGCYTVLMTINIITEIKHDVGR